MKPQSIRLQRIERQIVRFLQRKGITNRRGVADGLRLETSCVAGRVHSLIQKGLVREDGHMVDPQTKIKTARIRLARRRVV